MKINCPNIPPTPELTCSYIAHFSEVKGDEIWIDGRYVGHIMKIDGLKVHLEYKGENPYLNGQESVMHVEAGTAEQIKNIAL